MANRLYLRGSTYWAQLPVPPDVQHVFKKRNFQKTTRCKDKRNAGIQAALMIAEWQQQIDEARGSPEAVINKLANLKALNKKQRELKQFAFIEPADKTSDIPAIHGINGLGWTEAELTADAYLESLADSIPPSELLYFSSIYHGRTGVPNGLFTTEWIAAEFATNKPRTRTEAAKAARLSAQWFPTTDDWNIANRNKWLQSETRNRKSVQKDVGYLRSFFLYLQNNFYVDSGTTNPFAKDSISYPKHLKKPGEKERRPATKEEVSVFLRAAKSKGDDELYWFIVVGAATGMRIAEIGAAIESDLQDKDQIKCIRVKANAKTKASSSRLIPLPNFLCDQQWPKQPLNDKAVGKRFGRLKRSLGFGDDLVFHSIRKTFATVCEQQGINEGVAADLLGHEKQTMTYGLYSGGSSVTQKKTVVDIIDAYLDLEVQFFDLENQQLEP